MSDSWLMFLLPAPKPMTLDVCCCVHGKSVTPQKPSYSILLRLAWFIVLSEYVGQHKHMLLGRLWLQMEETLSLIF